MRHLKSYVVIGRAEIQSSTELTQKLRFLAQNRARAEWPQKRQVRLMPDSALGGEAVLDIQKLKRRECQEDPVLF